MGQTTAIIAAVALLPTSFLAVLLIPLAGRTSSVPDDAEKWFGYLLPWRWKLNWKRRFLIVPWLSITIPRIGHRKWTHYPELVLPITVAITYLAFTVWTPLGFLVAGACWGVVWHLIADAMTISGLRSLTNAARGKPKQRLHLLPRRMRVCTDGPAEPWFRRAWVVASIAAAAGILHLQREDTPAVDPQILVAAGAVLLLTSAPFWLRLRHARIKAEWTAAVIHSGAAAKPRESTRKKETVVGPRLTRIRETAVGYSATIKFPRGTSYADLEKHIGTVGSTLSRTGFRVRELRLNPNAGDMGRARVTIVLRDPFHNAQPTTSPLVRQATTSVWDPMPLGTDEEGRDVTLQWTPEAAGHTLIAGITGSGKSVCAHTFIAHTALDPNARLVLLDPNLLQFHHWQACTGLPVIGPNTLDAVRALETVQQHMQHRFDELKDTGQWIPSPGDPTYTVVIDEATKYIDNSTKEARELSARFTRLVLDMLQRGRAAGVRLILIIQRPSAELFPTDLRAQFPYRIGFRVGEAETTKMIFGTRDIPIHRIPQLGYEGVGYLGTETTGVPTRIRAHYLTQDHIKAISDRAAASRMHHALGDLAPLPPSPPSPRPKAADLRAQRDRERLLEVLPVTVPGLARDELERAVGSWRQVKPVLDGLVKDGRVLRDGAGRPGDRHRWRRAVQRDAQVLAQDGNDGLEPNDGGVHGPPT